MFFIGVFFLVIFSFSVSIYKRSVFIYSFWINNVKYTSLYFVNIWPYFLNTVFSKNIHKPRANIQSEAKVGKQNTMAASREGQGHDKHCCVPLCTGNGRLNPELSFHRLPKAPENRKAWIQAIRRDLGPLITVSDLRTTCTVGLAHSFQFH